MSLVGLWLWSGVVRGACALLSTLTFTSSFLGSTWTWPLTKLIPVLPLVGSLASSASKMQTNDDIGIALPGGRDLERAQKEGAEPRPWESKARRPKGA